ncbi:MAG: trigger factor [Christensenellales bacterium]
MNYTIDKSAKSEIKVSFTADATEFDAACEKAYQKVKGKFNIGGFRKGKAPRKVIEGLYGKGVFYEDALDIIIPEGYEKFLADEKNVEVVARPEVEKFDFEDDGKVTFTLKITVKPEVKLGEYKGLNIAKKVDKVTKAQVDSEIDAERNKQARIVDTEEAAKMHDIVNIDFKGSVDGVEFEGGSMDNYDLELGSGSFIPGFEDQLVGAKKGEDKIVKVKFPEDYHAENLKGKDAEFACKINGVKTKELPKLDDEFVKDISEFNTVDEYRKSIEKKLKERAEEKAERDFENDIIEKIVKNSKIDIPQAMLDAEVEDMIEEFSLRLRYQGLKFEDYLKYMNITVEDIKKDYTPQAEKAIRVRLVMEAIIKAEKIKHTAKELENKVSEYAKQSNMDVEKFKLNLKEGQLDYIAKQILTEKLLDMLKKENLLVKEAATKEKKAETDKA